MALTIRLTEDQERELQVIADSMSEKTFSKAILKLINRYMPLKASYNDQAIKIMELRAENKRLKESLRRLLDIDVEKEIATREARKLL
jgi:hypothetical protein